MRTSCFVVSLLDDATECCSDKEGDSDGQPASTSAGAKAIPLEYVMRNAPDLMPEEQLDSDNSDTAGLYEVNSGDAVQNQAYQPGRLAR